MRFLSVGMKCCEEREDGTVARKVSHIDSFKAILGLGKK